MMDCAKLANALTLALAVAAAWTASAADPGPFGIDRRVPWTTSHVTGTPEPPPPYRTERAFPNLTFKAPLEMVALPGTDRLFILEQSGKIFSFPNRNDSANPDLFLDVATELSGWDKVPDAKGFDAVYGLAFHPDFAHNHYCYVCYVLKPRKGQNLANGSRVSRFTVIQTNPPRADPKSEVLLLNWTGGGHNGGSLQFGPDRFLYISTGDAATPTPPDPFDTGQDISDLLSSILRIDVDHAAPGRNYAIPKDNPFITTPNARPEVWAYGFRNPWRMTFDRTTGNLWTGDVGWELWEMVYRVDRAGNYGWSITEGPQPVHPAGRRGPTPILPPQAALPHSESASITGGYVYRGKRLPALAGHYIFGDWETRRLWAARCTGPRDSELARYKEIAQTGLRIVAFGQDNDGELYVVDYEGGGIYSIVPNETAAAASQAFPRKLSDTGLFSSTATHDPAPGVVPFSINAEQWLDGATAQRFVAIPGAETPRFQDDKLAFPNDSVLVRTLSQSGRRTETQLLHFDGRQWHGYSYAWNDNQTDADLVDAAGGQRGNWQFASRAQCLTCHNPWAAVTLAYNLPQLEKPHRYASATADQVQTLRHVGLLPTIPVERKVLVNPYDESADLDARARSYLHVNCAHCHRFGGGGTATIDLRNELPLKDTKTVNAAPALGAFALDDSRIIAPGDPARSVLLYRVAKTGPGRMPHIGSSAVDDRALRLLEQWIRLLPCDAPPHNTPDPTDIDRLLSSTSGALTLLCAVESDRLPPDARGRIISKAAASPAEPVRDLFERFLPPDQRIQRLGTSIDSARLLSLPGDPTRGRTVFFQTAGGLCKQCHQIAGEGEPFGPDLTHIASRYDRSQLLESILQPSKTIAPEFATFVVQTNAGDTYTGLLLKRTPEYVLLKDVQKRETRLSADQISRLAPLPTSAMPDGLLSNLTPQQAADLLAFLSSLK